MALSITDTEALYLADFAAAFADGGTLVIYDGTEPATADTALTGQPVICTFYLQSPAYNAASMVGDEAVAVLKFHTAYTVAGDAVFYRVYDSGANCIRQGNLDELNLTGTTFINGDSIRIPG